MESKKHIDGSGLEVKGKKSGTKAHIKTDSVALKKHILCHKRCVPT